jgi:hypothetical protein
VGDISLHQANKLADKYYVSFSYKILLTDDEVKNSGDSEIIAEKYRGLALIKCEDGAWLIEDIGNGEYDAAGYIFCRDMFEDRQDWEIGSLLENASLQVNQFEEALRNGSLVESIKSYFANRDSIVAQENINGCLEEIYPYQEKYMSHKSK